MLFRLPLKPGKVAGGARLSEFSAGRSNDLIKANRHGGLVRLYETGNEEAVRRVSKTFLATSGAKSPVKKQGILLAALEALRHPKPQVFRTLSFNAHFRHYGAFKVSRRATAKGRKLG